jgi:hypothetical protein
MKHIAQGVLAAAGLALGAAPASAGALGKVVNGLEHATGAQDGGKGGGAANDSSSGSGQTSSPAVDDDNWTSRAVREDPTAPLVYVGPYPSYPASGPADVTLYFGLQSVEDSDGSASVMLRTGYDDYGIALSDTSFFERVPQLDGRTGTLRLDVWAITGAYRAVRKSAGDSTSLWLHAGLGGASSNTDAQAIGLVLGAEILHNLSGALGLEASARLYILQDDVRARELRAGFAASVLRVSYRSIDFNVGPPLRGPEIGLALTF